MDPPPVRPATALAAPRSVAALIGTNPRVIADEVWAELLWAGMNLTEYDIPGGSAYAYYSMTLIRAGTLTWIFSGLRSDEIRRLRVATQRFTRPRQLGVLAADAVCTAGWAVRGHVLSAGTRPPHRATIRHCRGNLR